MGLESCSSGAVTTLGLRPEPGGAAGLTAEHQVEKFDPFFSVLTRFFDVCLRQPVLLLSSSLKKTSAAVCVPGVVTSGQWAPLSQRVAPPQSDNSFGRLDVGFLAPRRGVSFHVFIYDTLGRASDKSGLQKEPSRCSCVSSCRRIFKQEWATLRVFS